MLSNSKRDVYPITRIGRKAIALSKAATLVGGIFMGHLKKYAEMGRTEPTFDRRKEGSRWNDVA